MSAGTGCSISIMGELKKERGKAFVTTTPNDFETKLIRAETDVPIH